MNENERDRIESQLDKNVARLEGWFDKELKRLEHWFDKRFDENDEKLTSMKEKIDENDKKLTSMKEKIDEIDRKITPMEEKIDENDKKLTSMKEMNNKWLTLMEIIDSIIRFLKKKKIGVISITGGLFLSFVITVVVTGQFSSKADLSKETPPTKNGRE